jgi:outer membrane protein assembly factor BamB
MRAAVSVAAILLISSAVAANASDPPDLVWSFETMGKIYAAPLLADLDGDGTLEVIVAATQDRRLLCLDSAGNLRWAVGIQDGASGGLQATPSAVDYDGDGHREVFFVTKGGLAGCVSSSGELIWRRDLDDVMDYTGPVLADINNDGRVEIVFGSESGTLYCLGDAGEILWRYQGDGPIRGIPAVAAHPPSGTMRVYATFGGGREACFSSEGDLVWYHDEPMPRKERRSGPAVGDLDGDGAPEVVSATDDFQVIVRDAFTGKEKWRWKGEHAIDQTNSFALVDFDGSGRLDIVCGDGSGQGGPGNLYRLRDGEPVWTADAGGSIVQGPCVGDVDGDGELEMLVCSRSQRLICYSAGGEEEWSVPFGTEIITTPAIGDLDGDGTVEIVVTSKDRSIYCFSLGGATDLDSLPWPMMNHDAQLTGYAEGARFQGTAAAMPTSRVEALALVSFEGLRLGGNRIEFTFANDDARPRRLEAVAEVLRPDGSLVTHIASGRREPFERISERFDLPCDGGGTYGLRLRLTDLGTGETVASLERDTELDPLAVERDEFVDLDADARALLEKLPPGELRARAETALNEARGNVEQAIAAAEIVVSRGPGQELDTALAAISDTLRDFRRHVARLRAATLTPPPADFAAVPETTLTKVFRDEPFTTGESAPRDLKVTLARNEYEGVQLVVVPLWKDLENLRVTAGELKHTATGAILPARDITVNRVGYVEIGPSEYNWYVEKQGFYPDILFPDTPANIPQDYDTQPFFITVRAAHDTGAGDYEGVVRVEADGCPAVELPFSVRVWDFALSDETHLKTSLWMSEGQIASFYKFADGVPFDVRKRWYDYHLDRRIGPVKDFPLGGGDRIEDFEYLIGRGMNSFFLPLPGHLPEERRPRFANRLRETEAILDAKGWKDLAYLYTRDELSVMGRHEIPEAVEFSQWVHTVAPNIPRLQTSPPEHALLGMAEVWCPLIDHFDPAMLEDRMNQGERLWFYTVWGRPGIMIEFPATDHRVMFWQCWKYGAEGFLYWGTTHWALNMTTDQRWPDIPWIPWNSQPGHNGCGYLLYPGPNAEPLGSIRMEIVRDGIEDYEYFWLLRDLLAKAGDKLPVELRERAESILAVNPEVVVDNKNFTEDPADLLAARENLAQTIEAMVRVAQAK